MCDARPYPNPFSRGVNSPKVLSRFEPLNCSSRRESAQTSSRNQMERTHVRCYEVHGEGESFAGFWHFKSRQLRKTNPQNLECATPVPSPGGEGQGEGGRETNLASPQG